MSDTIKDQIHEYYNNALSKLNDKSADTVKNLKLGITVTFVQSYMQSVFQAIAVSVNSKDQTGAALVLGTVEKISDGIGNINKDADIDEKTMQLIDVLENVETPTYSILKVADINVPLIDTMTNDFSTISEFLKDA